MNKVISVLAISAALLAAGNVQAGLPDAIKAKYNGEIQEGQITLKAPELAENGTVVPVAIKSANVPANTHIKEIAFYSANNTQCPIASYKLTPAMYSEGLGTRIKLAKTTDLYAVAQLDDGRLISGERKVKVTIGGCGGGGKLPDYSQMEFCKKQQ